MTAKTKKHPAKGRPMYEHREALQLQCREVSPGRTTESMGINALAAYAAGVSTVVALR